MSQAPAWLTIESDCLGSPDFPPAETKAATIYQILDWLQTKGLLTPSGVERAKDRSAESWPTPGIYRDDVKPEAHPFLDREFTLILPIDIQMVTMMPQFIESILPYKLDDAWGRFTGDKYRDLKARLDDAQSNGSDSDLCNAVAVIIDQCQWFFPETKKCLADQWTVKSVWAAAGIIGNGGFEYLFSHEWDDDLDFLRTMKAFDAIECPQALDAMRAAFRLFQHGKPPRDSDTRMTEFRQVPESTRDAVSSEFFRVLNSGAIERALAAFIRANPKSFTVSN
ncbi:MAG TPA: DUF4375 domain-containing protein [Pirellulaceae bacterium]|nr:DUF4375 domain-containing protein [Pirellulaceae bacterium]